jgi:proliferating cell nuclear antigen
MSTKSKHTKKVEKAPRSLPEIEGGAEQDAWQPRKGNILEVKAHSAQPFRGLLEALKAVLMEANLVFSDNGLRMAAIDNNRNVLAHLAIPVASFENYHCKERLVLGVDIALLQKIVRTAKPESTLTFVVHEDSPQILGICLDNVEKASEAFWPLPLRQLSEYNVKDSITFKEPPPQMPSTDFQDIVRNMLSVGATRVEIQNLGDELTFIARDGPMSPRYTQKLRRPELPEGVRQEEKEPELARGVFMLRYLQGFTKATAMSTHVHLYLQTKNPLLICEYSVFGLGTLKYALTGKQD